MVGVRSRGEQIRHFILHQIHESCRDVVRVTSQRFEITRQAVNKHLQRLVEEGVLEKSGTTRARVYRFAPMAERVFQWEIRHGLAEDIAWMREVRPILGDMPNNALDIWEYGFTEMFNNAIDHSEGSVISVSVKQTAFTTEMLVADDGYGIFRKIQHHMNLLDERHSILELSKGKLTTDPQNHTGEGIFFTSRMFDSFGIMSGGVCFSHESGKGQDWILEVSRGSGGTYVWMNLNHHTARTSKQIFDQYTSGDDYGFTKTVIPVKMAQYGNDKLVSRSQAKRLLARVELFQTVIFEFHEVEMIGQAFADEIFRVFALKNPGIELIPVSANKEIQKMIARAKSAR